ncbi:MAG: PIN domain-containing protein [Bifidobacteriaceae bacterium]|jgi:predicted nucleic acid-binding protein|nr:PIN domain-containing protein [Bifidobacteriaceae bacterium]
MTTPAPGAAPVATPVYVDTSVLGHALLGTDPTAAKWFAAASSQTVLMSSTLLRLEATRLLRRESLDPGLAEPYLQRIALVSIDDRALRLAATFTPHIKTLDSIHVATLLLTEPDATLVTHDAAMRDAARHLGIDVIDPLAGT